MKCRILPILMFLAALLLTGCGEATKQRPGRNNFRDSLEVQFLSEAELTDFLKNDQQTAEFEKEQIPVYGYYYRLKRLPYAVSEIEIDYRQDTVSISYYTDDEEFTRKNGGIYFAMLTWNRDKEQAQAEFQKTIETGDPPADNQKSANGNMIFYGEASYPAGEEGGEETYASAYYFIQDSFLFSVHFNFRHADDNFYYCELEKVTVK